MRPGYLGVCKVGDGNSFSNRIQKSHYWGVTGVMSSAPEVTTLWHCINPRFESRCGQSLCFQRKSLRYAALGTGCTLTAVPRSTQPSILRGTANYYCYNRYYFSPTSTKPQPLNIVFVSGMLRRRRLSYHRHVEPPLVIVHFRLLRRVSGIPFQLRSGKSSHCLRSAGN